ncbi:hypothetical protein MRB53_028939 [Persea americana]|uniref:Uncharacterized protein n=1 Tax=Persea americana TaxID=3435 RepID=A0ACC2KHG6_PERAE|nr:hypothetical protein MRB53_028939 [Persea americana]
MTKVTWTWWYIWKIRSAILFQSQPFHPNPIVGKICNAMREWNVVCTLLTTILNPPMPPENWTAPPPPTHKLNVDGSFNNMNGTTGIGGIIHDNSGWLLLAFACAITAHSATDSEMQALLRGTQLCVENGLTDVIVEGDSFHLELSSLHYRSPMETHPPMASNPENLGKHPKVEG